MAASADAQARRGTGVAFRFCFFLFRRLPASRRVALLLFCFDACQLRGVTPDSLAGVTMNQRANPRALSRCVTTTLLT
jgi:hypothetical protein